MTPEIASLVERQHVIVCCGTGGVGKTTAAAAFAVEAARRGRRAVVVTIDPARRLGDTLGIETLSNAAHEIERHLWSEDRHDEGAGRLSALMLDARSTFDGLVTRHARSETQAARILENRFYRNVAGALSGTQEYMAMERLHELHEESRYDLIVVDTPPTRHALDFLDAPSRLLRLLDNRMFKLLTAPTRPSLRAASTVVQTFLHATARVVGAEAIDDVVTFLRAFEGMEQGFRRRAGRVAELLAEGSTSFVLVTTPRRAAVEEAQFFARKLGRGGLRVDALVVNRMHPDFSPAGDHEPWAPAPATPAGAVGEADVQAAAARIAASFATLADLSRIATRERRIAADAAARVGSPAVAHVPLLPTDVHDFTSLAEVGRHLFAHALGQGTRDAPG